jgi:hypothetical protein
MVGEDWLGLGAHRIDQMMKNLHTEDQKYHGFLYGSFLYSLESSCFFGGRPCFL